MGGKYSLSINLKPCNTILSAYRYKTYILEYKSSLLNICVHFSLLRWLDSSSNWAQMSFLSSSRFTTQTTRKWWVLCHLLSSLSPPHWWVCLNAEALRRHTHTHTLTECPSAQHISHFRRVIKFPIKIQSWVAAYTNKMFCAVFFPPVTCRSWVFHFSLFVCAVSDTTVLSESVAAAQSSPPLQSQVDSSGCQYESESPAEKEEGCCVSLPFDRNA